MFVMTFVSTSTQSPAQAQNPVLAEMFGRGVHAYYAGRYNEAYQYLSMAINNGSKDPRAYYFRGLVTNAQGRQYEAESDWRQGAELEAKSGTAAAVGRSLARFQGPERLKLEEFRQKARLEALSEQMMRSQQRYGELGVDPNAGAGTANRAAPRNPIQPPPAAPPADDNPFADDMGDPTLEADDAFADPSKADPLAEMGTDAAADGASAGGADPFGGSSPDAGADPFGGATTPDAGADPFGGDGGAMEDPFGADPFQ